MDHLDARVRLAAFRFLEEQVRILPEIPLSITTVPIVEGEKDILDEEDGPMLTHGLQGFHGAHLLVPRRVAWRPDRSLLEERYALFRRVAG